MPVVLRLKGYRFEFFSSDMGEPPHIHVRKDSKSAKYWIEPVVRLAFNKRFRPHELSEVEKIPGDVPGGVACGLRCLKTNWKP